MRTTEHPSNRRRPLDRIARFAGPAILCCVVGAALLLMAGCSTGQDKSPSTGSSDASPAVGAHMAGPAAEVRVSQAVVDARPQPWDLKTPESAVRSYLDWTSYVYRIGQSALAKDAMSADQEVLVDSYIQFNIQQGRLLDQTLESIDFGTPSVGGTSTLVPAKEQWTYSYRSIDTGNKMIGGPYTVGYDTVYTVVKSQDGLWVVDSVKATPTDTLK